MASVGMTGPTSATRLAGRPNALTARGESEALFKTRSDSVSLSSRAESSLIAFPEDVARPACCTLSQVAEKRVKVLVSGRVQGVFFRAECASRARKLGVGGHARNVPDGRVEVMFEGESDAVDAMVEWCRAGPPLAHVESVEVQEESPKGDRQFRVSH